MHYLKKILNLNQRGVLHLIPLLLLLGGIATGVYLVQKEGFQIFKPKADAHNVQISGSCVEARGGEGVLTCPTVDIKFLSPLEAGQVSDSGSSKILSELANMSLVKTAYANDFVSGGFCQEDTSKIYATENGVNNYVADSCLEGTSCKRISLGAACFDSEAPVMIGDRWSCEADKTKLKKNVKWYEGLVDQHISCPSGMECKEIDGGVTCAAPVTEEDPKEDSAQDPGQGSGSQGVPANIEPNGDVTKDEGGVVRFYWAGPSNAKAYRFMLQSNDDPRKVGAETNCKPAETFVGNYRFCYQNSQHVQNNGKGVAGSFTVHQVAELQDGATYTWWVDALDDNGETLSSSKYSTFTLHITKKEEEKKDDVKLKPENLEPVKDTSVQEGGQVDFFWKGVSGAKQYRFLIDSDDDLKADGSKKKGGGAGCPTDVSSNWFYCEQGNIKHENLSQYGRGDIEGGGLGVRAAVFKDGKHYTWWVDPLDEKGESLSPDKYESSTGTYIKVDVKGQGELCISRCDSAQAAGICRGAKFKDSCGKDVCNGAKQCAAPAAAGDDGAITQPGAAAPVGGKCTTTCVYSQQDSDGVHCYSGVCASGASSCSFNDKCVYSSSCSQRVACPGGSAAQGGTPGGQGGSTPGGGSGVLSGSGTVSTCKGSISRDQLRRELEGAGYQGPWDQSSAIAAYNNAACASAPADCKDNPPVGGSLGDRPDGYTWKASCTTACQKNADCPQNTFDPSNVRASTSNWCYGFEGGNRCLMLVKTGGLQSDPRGGAGGQSDTGSGDDQSREAGRPTKETTRFRFAENPNLESVAWRTYTNGGVTLSYTFNNRTADDQPRFIYAEFEIVTKDASGNVTDTEVVKADLYPTSVMFPKPEADPDDQSGDTDGLACPVTASCCSAPLQKCGPGVSGSKFDGVSKDTACPTGYHWCNRGYCVNENYDGNGATGKCSAAPASGNNNTPTFSASCSVSATSVNINDQVTFYMGISKSNATVIWGGDASGREVVTNGSAQVTKTFTTPGYKSVFATIVSGSEQVTVQCLQVQVKGADQGGSGYTCVPKQTPCSCNSTDPNSPNYPGKCQNPCNGGWCKAGKCETCSY